MAHLKTTQTDADVGTFLSKLAPAARQKDAERLVALFERAIGAPARMWGTSIVGFGEGSYQNAAGKDVPWFLGGFSPRARNFALYLSTGELDTSGPLFPKLGSFTSSKGCLYVRALEDVDCKVLEQIVRAKAAGRARRSKASNEVTGASTTVKAKKRKVTNEA